MENNIIKIGVDCDGILADFSKSFSKVLNEMYGDHIPIVSDPEVKHWDWYKWFPISREEAKKGFETIHTIPDFWEEIHLLIDRTTMERFVEKIGKNPQIDTYFITSRSSSGNVSAAQQTWRWLRKHGWPHPHVIADPQKGLIANALGLKYMVDDSGRNCLDLVEKAPHCKVYMLDALHNRDIHHDKIRRIYDLNEYIDDVLTGK